mgnify:CR=1 FL=1
MACAFVLTGCGSGRSEEEKIPAENPKEESAAEEPAVPEFESGSSSTETDQENSAESVEMEPEITEADWSDYFGGLNGTAVIYDPSASQYTIYNPDLAVTRSSPCSTFKVISSLIGLESGIIDPENSTRTWSGEIFWNEDWNRVSISGKRSALPVYGITDKSLMILERKGCRRNWISFSTAIVIFLTGRED